MYICTLEILVNLYFLKLITKKLAEIEDHCWKSDIIFNMCKAVLYNTLCTAIPAEAVTCANGLLGIVMFLMATKAFHRPVGRHLTPMAMLDSIGERITIQIENLCTHTCTETKCQLWNSLVSSLVVVCSMIIVGFWLIHLA